MIFFTNKSCNVIINACQSNPCKNGACNPIGTGYTCTCPFGYTGSTCQTIINNCNSNPCQNNGTCNSFIGGYVKLIIIYSILMK